MGFTISWTVLHQNPVEDFFFPVASEKNKHWRNILPRLLCATAFHSEGTCSGFGVSSALRRQICTAKAPWELQREGKGQNHVSRSALCDLSKKKEALLNCVLCLFFYHCISFSLSSPSLRSAFLWSSYTNSQSGDVGRPSLSLQRLAAYERASQGIVEIIITVIALVNTSEMVTQDRSVSQSLFLEGVPVPDA